MSDRNRAKQPDAAPRGEAAPGAAKAGVLTKEALARANQLAVNRRRQLEALLEDRKQASEDLF
ncbi:hypothetical protein N8I74_11810 [Chitiniphilus purpureus]|uniref:Uncharacterized protein n=1 Tax=Chitiniphilus purpureus TaxID=2981137 RepID=A0ABY6DQ17_9NEIS|nr:hypothetical protein [Chitiniphilus sp. CD1]UXY14008.1 hypothetical protein N8I74_11810 [Chitiniphilus sp. CD1]